MSPTVTRVFYFNQEPLTDPKAFKTEASEDLMADRVEENLERRLYSVPVTEFQHPASASLLVRIASLASPSCLTH